MVKIIWEGNQDWDKEYPEGRPPENARKLQRPADVLKASVPYGIIPMLICFSCVFYKKSAASGFLFDPRLLPLSFVLGFLCIPLHELLHAVCYPRQATVYLGVCLKKAAAYAVSFYPLSRRRFIVMSLAPLLLGAVPLLVFILCPADAKALLTICLVPSFMGLISPAPDYMDVLSVIRQVPPGATIRAANDGLYWKK